MRPRDSKCATLLNGMGKVLHFHEVAFHLAIILLNLVLALWTEGSGQPVLRVSSVLLVCLCACPVKEYSKSCFGTT